MEIKALHCSDIHLDAAYSGIWDKGNIKRKEQRELFSSICRKALDEKVDLVLIAGDLFELSRIHPDTIRFIKDQLRLLTPIPVYISPGNEDPFSQESPYSQPGWPPNTVIFNTNRFKIEEIPEKNIFIYGAANRSGEDHFQPLKSLHLKKKEGIHIALFHGSYSELRPRDKIICLPFTLEEVKASRLHYLALGHFHEKKGIPEEKPVAFYCGAPDYFSFDETGDRGVILAKITEQGSEITFTHTWKREFRTCRIDCHQFRNAGQISEYLCNLSREKPFESSLTRVILTGRVSFLLDINSITEAIKDNFYHIVIKNETEPFFDMERLKEEKTTRGLFTRKMTDLISQSPDREIWFRKALHKGLESFISRKAAAL